MFTKNELEKHKKMEIGDYPIERLLDIADIQVDTNKCVADRIKDYLEKTENPYLFKVGRTPVKVIFSSRAPSLQECLLKALENIG
ncbi:MAG: hypothetical protein LBL66_04030 [Clostridiales bacterium]|jgi:hypothetical protein|nr:hypothetical protein [Clostridiales bacterium]